MFGGWGRRLKAWNQLHANWRRSHALLPPPASRLAHLIKVVDYLIELAALAGNALGSLETGAHIVGVSPDEPALLELLSCAAAVAQTALIVAVHAVLPEWRAAVA